MSEYERILIVGPSGCGKTYLLMNQLMLIKLMDEDMRIKVITNSSEQYEQFEFVYLVEDFVDISGYNDFCVVFEDIDSKLKKTFFSIWKTNTSLMFF